MFGSGRQISATASTANFLQPSDDLGYQLSYRHPELRGPVDPKRTEFNAAVFNTRKLSAVFAAGGACLWRDPLVCPFNSGAQGGRLAGA